MNKISFTMSVEDYVSGMKLKNKLLKKHASANNILLTVGFGVVLVAFLALSLFVGNVYTFFLFVGLIVATTSFKIIGQNKALAQLFYQNKVLSSMQTVYTDENGVFTINGYEKSFTPFNKIFLVRETDDKVYIFTSLSKGMLILNKQSEKQNDILELCNVFQHYCPNVYEKVGGKK